ncbi:ATP-grasp domain-containing protein [Limnoglobus roseus]|uniref:RimK family alpha-L-glutamate ligase n=1 Tax=Limnoglobus roseus TaxID=2598579 RepID=A0A5C1AFS4_9BACT|nr:RimK family alpha-L-glutamate ligase [Limnoglobus roseus]QEL15838.1 RimK family alpha-L-glutamate ligase [Limnoglobus roseus]
MRLAILSRGDGWHVQDLLRAARDLGHTAAAVDFRRVSAGNDAPLSAFDAAIIRTMPAGSLEQVVFRMDVMHAFEASGRPILNPPRAVETCVDKYLTNVRLANAGLPVPRTVVCQLADDAIAAFDALGGDVVVKPLFGAEGRGMVRVTDRELAWRTFHAIEQTRGVLYVQQFVKHPGWDVRAFVLNGKVLAAMTRTGHGDWRTNVAQGGTAERHEPSAAVKELAVKSAAATGAIVAGVDLLLNENGEWLVIEVNAVPGWKALAPTCGLDVAAAVVRAVGEG